MQDSAAAAAEDAQERADQATIADAHAATEAEIAKEDAQDVTAGAAIDSLAERLVAWLKQQPDVTEATRVSTGIFGFVLAGAGDMSGEINQTGKSPL